MAPFSGHGVCTSAKAVVFCLSVCLPVFREILEGIAVATKSNGVQSRKPWGVNIFEKLSSTTPTEDKYL